MNEIEKAVQGDKRFLIQIQLTDMERDGEEPYQMANLSAFLSSEYVHLDMNQVTLTIARKIEEYLAPCQHPVKETVEDYEVCALCGKDLDGETVHA